MYQPCFVNTNGLTLCGDATMCSQAVLACDVERTNLMQEEADILAKLPKVCLCGGGVHRWCSAGRRAVAPAIHQTELSVLCALTISPSVAVAHQ
jgi:hypothetical protein